MTTRTIDAAIIAIIMVGTPVVLINDWHRKAIAFIWPYLEAFWNTYIAF